MIREFVVPSKEHERALVACLWRNPRIYDDISNNKIDKDTFIDKSLFIYYRVGKKLIENDMYDFDEIAVEGILMNSPKASKAFYKAGGFSGLGEIMDEFDENVQYRPHLDQLLKYSSLRKVYKKGMIDSDNEALIEKLCSCTLSQAEDLILYGVDEAFENVDYGDYDAVTVTPEEMRKAIKEIKKGIGIGMPIYNAPVLTKQIKGFARGRMIYLALKSGEGKSTILRNLFLQSIIDNEENVLVLINEESRKDWIINLIIAVANTRLDKDEKIFKDTVFSGAIDEDDDEMLEEAIEWYNKNYSSKVELIALKSYRFKDVSKVIRKYAKLGFNYVLFDTFKPDSGNKNDMSRWERFGEMSQELSDLIKPENLNIGMIATVQLRLSGKERYLTHDSIAKAKEIVEVADITMLGRLFFKDEYPGESDDDDGFGSASKEIIVKVPKLVKGEWVPSKYKGVTRDKQYIIIYFGKNRAGNAQQQIVFEMDFDRNIVKEIGYCNMKQEY